MGAAGIAVPLFDIIYVYSAAHLRKKTLNKEHHYSDALHHSFNTSYLLYTAQTDAEESFICFTYSASKSRVAGR